MYESETWCLRENEVAILRTGRPKIRPVVEVKLIEKKSGQELLNFLDLKETSDVVAKANGVRWSGYVLKRNIDLLRRVLDLEEVGRKERE